MTVPLTNLQNSQRKHLCQSLFFNKVGGWKPKTVRSSLWKCSVKKGALKNFMWKHLCWSLFLITLRLAGPQNRSILCSYGNQVETSLSSCGDICTDLDIPIARKVEENEELKNLEWDKFSLYVMVGSEIFTYLKIKEIANFNS